jgi:hypothetical protein
MKKAQIVKGTMVTIYEDPFTCEKAEGKATLLTFLAHYGALQRWRVRFEDGSTFERDILIE